MGYCRLCGQDARTISDAIGYCAGCIRDRFDDLWPDIKTVHDRSRSAFGLPADPPRATGGRACPLCHHECRIPEGGAGYCGLRRVEGGRITGGRPHEGNLSYYFDPLPTNCVGSFVCPAGTNAGYPQHSVAPGPEYEHKNLAVFYRACSFNCLFCQNYHFKRYSARPGTVTATALAGEVDDETPCICYFGGDPGPQIMHALKTSAIARRRAGNRVLRICWETNGALRQPFLSKMAGLALESGGIVKFDLKAWDERLHLALCGVGNNTTLRNFEILSGMIPRRPDPPFLIASTLLVPGYVDETEVSCIAEFLAGLDPTIPYSLLAFHPLFYLDDLPATSRKHALRCRDAAMEAGLKTVHLGNLHLLGEDY